MTETPNEIPKDKDEDETNTKYIIINKSTIHNPSHFANLSRKLLCIEYPGMVENVNKMIETLGGMHSIEMAVGNYNRRLELRFRPDDIFSKPCWGDKEFNPGILVKITVRKPKVEVSMPCSSKSNDVDPDHLTTYHYQVIGVTAMTFKFTRMCDFQYLPLLPTKKWENSNSECRNIFENIIPPHLPTLKWFQSDDSCNMPLFLPPPLFAKFNSSKENKLFYERYKYYEKVIPEVAERLKKDSRKKQELKNAIDRTRAIRKVNSIFVNFNSKDVSIPQGPREGALNAIRKRGLDAASLKKVQQLFQERPIWSKSALLHKSGVRNDQLKAVLPAVAYHFPNGPWRVMWCRFAYDPRLDPTSRIYQTFDFRIRASVGLKVKVQAKRSYSSNLMHYRAGPVTTDKFSLKDCSTQKSKSRPPVDETFYILKPNMLPPARQMFYQYCDVQLPEIQNMLAKLPETTKDLQYHQKNGWLPNGFHDQCREIVNKYVTIQVKKLLLEDKKKKDEEQSTFSTQKVEVEKDDKQEDTVDGGAIDDLIVIDDDDSTENREDSDENQSGMGGGDELDGNVEMSDSEDDNDRRGANEDEDTDLDAVEEIDKIIGSMNEPNTSAQENYEEKEDSEDEFDPELISLYHKLIVSNSEPEKKLP